MKGYYFITDQALSTQENIAAVRAAVKAGVRVIQYRNKNGSTRQLYGEALELKHASGTALFIINDRVDIALAVGAGGVHIGADDIPYESARVLLGPAKIIGVSVQSVAEAAQAQCRGADYVGVGPVFATATKTDAGVPLGLAVLKAIKASVAIPVVAIGGITFANVRDVIEAGADAVCAIAEVVRAPDRAAAIQRFQQSFSLHRKV